MEQNETLEKDTTLFPGRCPEKVAPAGQFGIISCLHGHLETHRGRNRPIEPCLRGPAGRPIRLRGPDHPERVFPLACSPGGFRVWWRNLEGSDDTLDNTHLMRMAGRFSRCVRGWAKKENIPVIDCAAGERKHDIAEEHLPTDPKRTGIFLILVNRAPAPIWDVHRFGNGGIDLRRKQTYVEPLHVPHLGRRVGPRGDSHVWSSAVLGDDHAQRARVRGLEGDGAEDSFWQGGTTVSRSLPTLPACSLSQTPCVRKTL